MDFLQKLREQPQSVRKLIFWAVIIIVGLALFGLWLNKLPERLKPFKGKEFQLPSLEKELEALPKVEMPDIEIPGEIQSH